MQELQGRLVEICSHRYGGGSELFRVIEVRRSIGFVKLAPEPGNGAHGGFWVEIDAVREALPQPDRFCPPSGGTMRDSEFERRPS